MLALPFLIVGALLAHYGSGRALDMMAMIGIILLMGLVTKNSILLVEFTNQLKRRGRTTREALLEAGPVAVAADPHDHAGNDLRYVAGSAWPRRRVGAASAHGHRRDRRLADFDSPDPRGGTCRVFTD
jgi:hypothetical protein